MNDWQDSGYEKKRSWWSRNWLWAVPLGCLAIPLGCVALVGGAVAFGIHSLGASEPMQLALERIRAEPLVIEALGEPIEKTWLAGGNMNVQMSSGEGVLRADLPLKGPKGEAIAHVQASKESGKWQLVTIEVEVPANGDWILVDTGYVPEDGEGLEDGPADPMVPLEDPAAPSDSSDV